MRRFGIGATLNLFDPTQITGLKIWLRGDLGLTQTSNRVSQWNDQSGSAVVFSQGTAGSQPLYTASDLNGHPSVTLDSAARFLQVSSGMLTINQPMTIMAVMKQVSWTNARRIMDDTNNGRWVYDQLGTLPQLQFSASNTFSCTNGDLTVGTWAAVQAQLNAASSFIEVGNGTKDTGNPGTAGLASSIPMTLGTTSVNGSANVAFAEICIYNSALSDANRDKLLTYFSGRYGI